MAQQIDTTNPNTITYITEELGFTILGGIRMDGLDRLRVTIRIEVINSKFEHYQNNPELAALPLNHNLDLYNDVQVEKLIRKAAERLVSVSDHISSFSQITGYITSKGPRPCTYSTKRPYSPGRSPDAFGWQTLLCKPGKTNIGSGPGDIIKRNCS